MISPEEYVRMHKEAFRQSFDYLNDHFPPGTDTEYWKATCADGSILCAKHSNNPLLAPLMTAVIDYLEKESKRRKSVETEH